MKNKIQIFNTVKVIILAFILAAGMQYVSAQSWSAPTGSPPGNNTYAPLNVGTSGQTKDGGLTLGFSNTTQNALLVKYGVVGLGTTAPNAGSRLTVVGDDGHEEIVRLDSTGRRDSSYLKIWNDSGTNLIGVNGIGAWVGPDGNDQLGFKTNDLIRMKVMNSTGYVGIGPDLAAVDPSTNLDVNGTVRIRGGSPAAGEVLTATNGTGVATWEPVNQSIQPSYSYPQSVVSVGATDTQLGANPFSSNVDTYTASCPSGKILVSCSGGVLTVDRQVGITYDSGTIIVPNTSTQTCTMYTTEVGDLGPGGVDSAVRLYAMCI
jgi:hypothetical protein